MVNNKKKASEYVIPILAQVLIVEAGGKQSPWPWHHGDIGLNLYKSFLRELSRRQGEDARSFVFYWQRKKVKPSEVISGGFDHECAKEPSLWNFLMRTLESYERTMERAHGINYFEKLHDMINLGTKNHFEN